MPRNHLDRAIKTLNFNADIKALNTSIMVCQKTNSRKLWSDSPTSGDITDPCESMLRMEWKSASDWIPQRVSKFRWLVFHHLHQESLSLKYWSDEDITSEEDNDNDVILQLKDTTKTTFGPVPRFSQIYGTKVSTNTKVFTCSCCNQEIIGMPCCHIASMSEK
jgi:hypothetical protein